MLFAKESENSIRKNFLCVNRTMAARGGRKVACIACFVVVGRDLNPTEVWGLDFCKHIPCFATDKLRDLTHVTSEFCLSFAICKMGVNLPTSLHVVRLNSLVLAAWELRVPEKEGAKCKAQQSWEEYFVWISSGNLHGVDLHSVISI